MTNRLVLLLTLIIVAVYSASANHCEGQYYTNLRKILQKIETDRSYWVFGSKAVTNIHLNDEPFKDICNDLSNEEKLSICMKVLQHSFKVLRPTSFTVDPTESNYECKAKWFKGISDEIYHQRMYACPTTTIKFNDDRESITEGSFLVGQGLHRTKYQIRFFDGRLPQGPAFIQGQLTGFKLDALEFETAPNGQHTYKPHYDASSTTTEVVNFRNSGNINDYVLELESEPEQ